MRAPVLALLSFLGSACVSEKQMARASSRVDLGVAYLQENNPEGAVATLREATKLDPRNWRAFNALGMAYATKGDADLAEAAFVRALRINPTEGEILVNYGAYLTTVGRPKEAVVVFERAMADLDYRNPAMVLSNLSRAHLDAGDPAAAARRAEDALRRSPKMCPARFHLGLAHEALGKTDSALRDYATLIEECPESSLGGWLRTGCILRGLGDTTGAEAALRQVVDAAPDAPIAEQARACLAGGQ